MIPATLPEYTGVLAFSFELAETADMYDEGSNSVARLYNFIHSESGALETPILKPELLSPSLPPSSLLYCVCTPLEGHVCQNFDFQSDMLKG